MTSTPSTTTTTAATSNDNSRKRKTECPYLDTINRSALDFDFEPSCSVSLESGPHVYGCLVCGKFFRGRGRQTPAYTHSVDEGHFIFIHLLNGTFHCLPDDYQVEDSSLRDISAALHPTFKPDDISLIDNKHDLTRDLFGRRYLPGFVGLNNLHKTDCVNATVQALAHVPPLRDYFLRLSHLDVTNAKGKPLSPLVLEFGALVRKLWSDQRFKSHVDPHLLMQAISVASNKRYRVGHQAEAGEFMAWLLHQLHLGLGGGRKPGSSIIHKLFQGKIQVTTRQSVVVDNKTAAAQVDDRDGSGDEANEDDQQTMQPEINKFTIEETTTDTHFLQLTLDIPQKPLFRDDEGGLVIPQEPLVNVLKKFDGMTFSDALSTSGAVQRKRYRLLELPQYLVLHLARFTTNQYSKEKNPTIVAFPVKNLDLTKYVAKPTLPVVQSKDEIMAMSTKELKQILANYGKSDIVKNAVEKSDLVNMTLDLMKSLPDLLAEKYDLVANITHHSPADVGREGKMDPLQEGSYKCHVQHKGTGQWYVVQDLHVEETMPQLIGLSESYVLIFAKKKV
jgi:U4/U6.U5 tri-snRNP-associated protein 2